MYRQLLILAAIRHLQARRPYFSVLMGDIEDALDQRELTWNRSMVNSYLRQLVQQHVLEKLDRNVYRLIPTAHA
ncbi:MAG: hypothetical protein JWQ08_823 [Deinococcus sp.]|nr:hypothetical protein [Deinococcus sp.]